jgi:hypothetical protein
MNKISIEDLRKKLGTQKAFPIFKKNLTKSDMESIFSAKDLKGLSVGKNFTLGFGIFTLISGILSVNLVGMFIGMIFILIALFIKNPYQKFLLDKIKKNNETLLAAYENGLVTFYLYGQGNISYSETKIVSE